jgi:hypothetical protein
MKAMDTRQNNTGRAANLRPGDRVLSIGGEWDEGDEGERRETGPNATGEIQSFAYGHYDVTFDNGTHVRITPEEIADPAQYKILARGAEATDQSNRPPLLCRLLGHKHVNEKPCRRCGKEHWLAAPLQRAVRDANQMMASDVLMPSLAAIAEYGDLYGGEKCKQLARAAVDAWNRSLEVPGE